MVLQMNKHSACRVYEHPGLRLLSALHHIWCIKRLPNSYLTQYQYQLDRHCVLLVFP